MTTPAIEFVRVNKRFGNVTAVRDVSCAIEPGTLVTLLGPSGCGKTTMLRLIAGLELPTAGTIRIAGTDVTDAAAAERDVSMVFQSYALFPHMTVLENVRYGPTVAGATKTEADARARKALDAVGLAGYDARYPGELSGGQQQRVAVARALVQEPTVLLFDEPLSNLDAQLRRQMRDEIRDLQRRLALTVVYVTHDQAEAMAVSDRIIVMHDGAIAQDGAPRDVYERPASAFVARFMGEANRVRAHLRRRDANDGEVELANVRLRIAHRGCADGPVELAIRPEAIALGTLQPRALQGTVRKAAYLGSTLEYTIETAVGDLLAVVTGVVEPVAIGSTVGLTFAPRGVAILPSTQDPPT
jgi:iron(III) transport system ATP-binding protein